VRFLAECQQIVIVNVLTAVMDAFCQVCLQSVPFVFSFDRCSLRYSVKGAFHFISLHTAW